MYDFGLHSRWWPHVEILPLYRTHSCMSPHHNFWNSDNISKEHATVFLPNNIIGVTNYYYFPADLSWFWLMSYSTKYLWYWVIHSTFSMWNFVLKLMVFERNLVTGIKKGKEGLWANIVQF